MLVCNTLPMPLPMPLLMPLPMPLLIPPPMSTPMPMPATRPAYYTLYLNNLFTNVPLANALGDLGISIIGTTRQTTLGLPKELS
jgi:hypothetical protein